ncbi:MAG: cytochrome c biogenesis protein CcsA [Myxococcota bacterium]
MDLGTVGWGCGGALALWLAAAPVARARLPFAWEHPLGVAGGLGVAATSALGLGWAPAERYMGDVGRILYVHVPAAWLSLACFAVAGALGIGSLLTRRREVDAALAATCEVGVVLGALLVALGAWFARPTWGVWWTWDPRLVSTLVLTLSNGGLLLLRALLLDPSHRATATATGAVIAAVNVPIVYFSVTWFASIHAEPTVRPGESPIDPHMGDVLLLSTVALAALTVWFVARRARLGLPATAG